MVRTKLCQLAFEVFTSRPGEGETISGVLLGKAGRDGVSVTDYWQGIENRADVVGYWSVRRRVSQTWTGPEAEGLYLVVSPVTVQRAEALVWRREANGAESEARAMMFQVERRVSERAGRRTDVESAPAVVSRGWWWWALAVACLGLAVWMMRTGADVPVVRVALELQGGGDALKVRWREIGGGEAGRLESAALVVRQGREEETVDLSDRYVPEGGLAVQPKAQEIVVSLRVRRAGQPAIVRTVTYVDPGLATGKRLGGELEWLRWRNRELEETVATLQGRF